MEEAGCVTSGEVLEFLLNERVVRAAGTYAGEHVVKAGLVEKSCCGVGGAFTGVECVIDNPDGGTKTASKLRAVHGNCFESVEEEGHVVGRRYGRSVRNCK